MIREATMDDIPRLVQMAERFYATTLYASICPVSKPSLAGLAILTMDGEKGILRVAEQNGEVIGMVCLFFEPFLFNVSLTMASELVYWIEPEYRGGLLALRMLREVDRVCQAKGVDVIRMAALADSPPQAGALYEKMGYSRSDVFFLKHLSAGVVPLADLSEVA